MKYIFHIAIFILLFASTTSFGQSSQDGHENLIIFDPLFWKDQLKLSASQSKKIKEINVAYYEELLTFYKQRNASDKSMRDEIEFQLHKRSEKIWSTFDHKQRRRWERLNQQGLAAQSSL